MSIKEMSLAEITALKGDPKDVQQMIKGVPKGDPKDVKQMIKDVLFHNNEEAWKLMKRFILAPGINGNRHYDHCKALDHFLKKDRDDLGGKVTEWIDANGLRLPALWNMVARILRSMGWDLKNGYIVGIQDRIEQHRAVINDD